MKSSGRDQDDTPVSGNESPLELDDWSDPEKRLLRQEAEEEEVEESERQELGVFQRLDELLADFSPEERKVFWHVFVDGMSVAAAAREVGVSGNVHVKFKKMLAVAKEFLGDLVAG